MPFQSRKQQRWMFAAEANGELPKGTAKRWAKHTPNMQRLPESVKAAGLPAASPELLALLAKLEPAPRPPLVEEGPPRDKDEDGGWYYLYGQPEAVSEELLPTTSPAPVLSVYEKAAARIGLGATVTCYRSSTAPVSSTSSLVSAIGVADRINGDGPAPAMMSSNG